MILTVLYGYRVVIDRLIGRSKGVLHINTLHQKVLHEALHQSTDPTPPFTVVPEGSSSLPVAHSVYVGITLYLTFNSRLRHQINTSSKWSAPRKKNRVRLQSLLFLFLLKDKSPSTSLFKPQEIVHQTGKKRDVV